METYVQKNVQALTCLSACGRIKMSYWCIVCREYGKHKVYCIIFVRAPPAGYMICMHCSLQNKGNLETYLEKKL